MVAYVRTAGSPRSQRCLLFIGLDGCDLKQTLQNSRYPRRVASEEPVRLTDARAIRALAHPARLAVLDALNQRATLTATEAAEIAGLSPSAMSYHLRALAKWGIVRAADTAGADADGRERRWERAGAGLTFDPPDHGADAATAFIASHYLDQTRSQLTNWLEHQQGETDFWRENSVLAYRETWLTEQQALDVRRIADALVSKDETSQRAGAERPPGARRVRLSFLMFPIDEPAAVRPGPN